MSSVDITLPARRVGRPSERAGTALSLGFVTMFLTVVVTLPMAALVWESTKSGTDGLLGGRDEPAGAGGAEAQLRASRSSIAAINAVLGTLIAWVLVRDEFPGKSVVNAVIDLPFALPTIVAGLTLLALYGPTSPVEIDVAFTRTAIVMALLFVTLPFVVRTVQPVLLELDTEMEQAARSLGASELTVFRRVVLPNILPGILSGVALAFARAVGEIGSLVIIAAASRTRPRSPPSTS